MSANKSHNRWVTEETYTYADLVVEYLERLGVTHVFGVPGGAIEPFFNALAKSGRRGGITLVVARHENSAAFMADGYYRETGRLGVVCATTGPGATNLVSGASSALEEEVPLLIITAQSALPTFGRGALQDSSCSGIDTVGIFKHCTKLSTLVSHGEQVEHKMMSAIMDAYRTPIGPVHLSFPADVLADSGSRQWDVHPSTLCQPFSYVDQCSLNALCDAITEKTMCVYLGSGIAQSQDDVMAFIEATNTPFVIEPMAKGWVNEQHRLYRGVYGFAGHDSADQLINHPQMDVILAVGTSLNELSSNTWDQAILNTKLIHIDSVQAHFARSPMARLHVYGHLGLVFQHLLANVHHTAHNINERSDSTRANDSNCLNSHASLASSEQCLSTTAPVKPQLLMTLLSNALPDNTRIFIDAGNAWAWATHYLQTSNTQGHYRIAMGYGSMTWAIGASVGSSIGHDCVPTLCIVGDGSYLMSAQELTVAVTFSLPIIFLVLNDSALGMVMHGQQLANAESIGWELSTIDYAAIANGLGVHSINIESAEQLNNIYFDELYAQGGPVLLDVQIDRHEVPPMMNRVAALQGREEAIPSL